jgi:hypothetical protein
MIERVNVLCLFAILGGTVSAACDNDVDDTGCGAFAADEVLKGDISVRTAQDLEPLAGIACIRGVLSISPWEVGEPEGDPCLLDGSCIATLDGLEALQHVGGLSVSANPNLSSLAGLASLERVTPYGVIFERNPSLTSLHGLERLEEIGLALGFQETRFTDMAGLDRLERIGGTLSMVDTDFVSLAGLPALASIGGLNIAFGGTPLDNLDGLEAVTEIEGDIFLDKTSLVNLDGLQNVARVKGSVQIGIYGIGNGNASLASIGCSSPADHAARLSLRV